MIDIKDLDVFVLATHHRPIIITEYLKNIPHYVHYNPDYNWEPNLPLVDALVKMAWNPLNMYRAFRAHVDALKMATKKYILILEDDARPNRNDWFDIVLRSDEIVDNGAEIASYHGRECDPRDLDYIKYPGDDKIMDFNGEKLCFSKPVPMANDAHNRTWCLGSCMAYLIKDTAKHKMVDYKYDGLPIDFIVPSRFDCYVLRKTSFIHDRVHGTLMN